MVPFAHLGRLQERLKALTLAANLAPNEQCFLAQLKTSSSACRQICQSSTLKNVLAIALVMYNYVNFGQVERCHAHAFDIGNLLQLSDFRADKNKNFTALHYVATRLLAEAEGEHPPTRLHEELSDVQEAAKVCLCSVEAYVKQLRLDLQSLREEQMANAKVYGFQEPATEDPPPGPAPDAPRRPSVLSEVTEVSDDEHITPRTYGLDLPQPTPRCRARMACWVRHALGHAMPMELGELARGMPQQVLEPNELTMIFEGHTLQVNASISNLGLLYFRDLQQLTQVRAVPLAGSEVSLPSECSSQEVRFELAYAATATATARLTLKLPDLNKACSWRRALQQSSQQGGAGWLKVQNALGFFRWNWVTLLTVPRARVSDLSLGSFQLQPGSRWLVWFKKPEDLLQGQLAGGVELQGHEVFTIDARRRIFSVGHIKRCASGRVQLKQLALRASSEEEMQRWITVLQRLPEEEFQSPPRLERRTSQSSVDTVSSSGGRLMVPRLNLPAKESARSKASAASSTSTEYSSPYKEPKLKKDTMWTTIQREIITPRPGMSNAPRIVTREEDATSQSNSDSDSESTVSDSASTVSAASGPAAAPAPPAPPAPVPALDAPMSTRGPRGGSAVGSDVTTFSRMSALAEEAERSANLLEKTWKETLEEGKQLLLFLQKDVPSDPAELGTKVRSVFETISKFVGQLKGAAKEVERKQKMNKEGHLNCETLSFRRKKTPTAPAAPAAASVGPARSAPDAQCQRLARDCIAFAVAKACKAEVTEVPPRCWERGAASAPAPAKVLHLEELD